MDALSQILSSNELSGGVFARCQYRGRWAMDMYSEDAHMLFHIVKTGAAVFEYLGDSARPKPIQLSAGDVVVLPFGDRHRLSQGAIVETPVLALSEADLGGFKTVRGGPSDGAGDSTVLCGYYRGDKYRRHPLLRLLEPVMHIRAGPDTRSMLGLITLIDAESAALADGSRVIMDRLAEALLLYLLRAWTQQQATPAGLLAALADAQIGTALLALHRSPEQDWSVAGLARLVGASRAKFAKRFQTLIGCGPFQYLTELRMNLAAQYLREQQLPLAVVAERVGYRSEAAFAKVFKKHTGVPPGRFRKL